MGDQGCSNFQRNKQRQRPSYTRASAHPLANAKHKGETELRTNTGHQSTSNSSRTLHKNLRLPPPSARLRHLAATQQKKWIYWLRALLLLLANENMEGPRIPVGYCSYCASSSCLARLGGQPPVYVSPSAATTGSSIRTHSNAMSFSCSASKQRQPSARISAYAKTKKQKQIPCSVRSAQASAQT